jgi:FMN phosphatase YigB (HAD superfamily)
MNKIVLVLDAMGVIYQAADDVAELLVPFVAEHGGTRDEKKINDVYDEASRGKITADELWKKLGVDPGLEDQFLARHRLTDGLIDFLSDLPEGVDCVWCLSNDVSDWSKKLRERFKLAEYFAGFVISGDERMRKPDPAIYELLLGRVGRLAGECVFVDDRPSNLQAAKRLGFRRCSSASCYRRI